LLSRKICSKKHCSKRRKKTSRENYKPNNNHNELSRQKFGWTLHSPIQSPPLSVGCLLVTRAEDDVLHGVAARIELCDHSNTLLPLLPLRSPSKTNKNHNRFDYVTFIFQTQRHFQLGYLREKIYCVVKQKIKILVTIHARSTPPRCLHKGGRVTTW